MQLIKCPRWSLECCGQLHGCCYALAKMFWVVARVFACVKLTSTMLEFCVWLPGHCYAVAKMF